MIDVARDVHPLSDFKRRTSDLMQRLRDSGRPMLLTLNGRPEVVVLGASSYQKLMDQLRDYESRLGVAEDKVFPPSGVRKG